jgi:hypothetical protein
MQLKPGGQYCKLIKLLRPSLDYLACSVLRIINISVFGGTFFKSWGLVLLSDSLHLSLFSFLLLSLIQER